MSGKFYAVELWHGEDGSRKRVPPRTVPLIKQFVMEPTVQQARENIRLALAAGFIGKLPMLIIHREIGETTFIPK
jgi:hypothetical protein